MEELRDQPVERAALASLMSRTLAAIHAGSIGGIVLVAPFFVPYWLPAQSATILAILPIFLFEQVAGVLLAPAQVSLPASGRFGYIGGANVLAGMTALGIAVLTMPFLGPAGFGVGLSVGALLVAVPMMLAGERGYWRSVGVDLPLRGRFVIGALSAVPVGLLFVQSSAAMIAALLLGGFALWELQHAYAYLRRPVGVKGA
jgi:hypothetical protein